MAPETTVTEIELIAKAAERAARSWRQRSAQQRALGLVGIADALDAAGDELVAIAMEETHLLEDRLRGELRRTTFQLRLYAQALDRSEYLDVRIDHADDDWPMGAPRPDLRRTHIPLGPVLVFAASNFPFAFSVAGGDTASALAAGCSVIVKAHPGHLQLSAQTAKVVERALRAVAAPEGLFSLIVGNDAAQAALRHPLVKAGAFTGSIAAGRQLLDIANARPEPIPFFGELGSVNPVFVTGQDAVLDTMLAGFIGSFTSSNGQLCTKPGVLVVPRSARVPQRLARMILPVAAPMLNEAIQAGYITGIERLADAPGASLLVGRSNWLADPPAPTLFQVEIAEVLNAPFVLLSEVFGPAAIVVEYDDHQDATRLCRELEGQLTISVFGDVGDPGIAELVDTAVGRAGRVLWNQWPTGVSVTHAQQHGGPYPATTSVASTSVGTAAITRFLRPVTFQGFPDALLPEELRESNPLGIARMVNGTLVVP
ncbi:aldehyde dehydrogenase (NADP(+)) [Leucobacter sp. BZR 635]